MGVDGIVLSSKGLHLRKLIDWIRHYLKFDGGSDRVEMKASLKRASRACLRWHLLTDNLENFEKLLFSSYS